MLAVSCQKESVVNVDNETEVDVCTPCLLTASFVETKVSYTETPEMNLQPAWEIGDEIIGFDSEYNTYTLTVKSVSGKIAALEGTVPDGMIHLIYKSGAKASDIISGSLAIDYTSQRGDETMPAVMLSDGEVVDGGCHFHFSNAGAVIGISAVNGVPKDSTVVSISIEGQNLSFATVSLKDGILTLTPTEKSYDSISLEGVNSLVGDEHGTLSNPVFISVPAGAKISKVSAYVAKNLNPLIPDAMNGVEGVDYVTIAGLKWAKWNIGASGDLPVTDRADLYNRSKEFGWHFAWGAKEGFYRYLNTWQSSLEPFYEFYYSPSSVRDVSSNDYLYIKAQHFKLDGHLFSWATSSTPKNINDAIGTICPSGVLASEYDTATTNWGGTWRMPTEDDYESLISNTYWAHGDSGDYVFSPVGSHQAGSYDETVPDDLDKNDALMFFPAPGYGVNGDHNKVYGYIYYWTSCIDMMTGMGISLSAYWAPAMFMNPRYCGLPVRAVSDL